MSEVTVRIEITAGDASPEWVDAATRRLRKAMHRPGMVSVDIVQATQPEARAKSGADLLIVGTLLVTTSNSALLSGVVDIVKSWLGKSADRSAHLEIDGDIIDVNKVTRSEQEKLIDQWLARHRRLED